MKNTYVFAVYQMVGENPVWKNGRQIRSKNIAGAIKRFEKTKSDYSDDNPYQDLVNRYPKESFMLGIRQIKSRS